MSGFDLRKRAELASAQVQYQVERWEAELGWAATLCELNPPMAKTWRALIDRAQKIVARRAGDGRWDELGDAIREAEKALAPVGKAAKTYTAHCVGHAHIDMNWMWSWPETVAVTVDTFLTVLRLMEEYPDFCFSQSQAGIYAIIEQYRPDLLRQIARRIAEGRWEVTASHWVENDQNLAGGEALCRHLLYTRRYMRKLFGLKPEDVPIDWAPDTFGHAVTAPTYLARGGVKYLYLHRPGVHGPLAPRMFWWQGPDGSRVLVRNDVHARRAYNGAVTPGLVQEMADFVKATGLKDFMFVYGVGDHGGGPTRHDIEYGRDMAAWPIFPNIRFGTARGFFEVAEKAGRHLPVLDRELNTEFTGCYTSQALIKRNNRYGENRLADAETAAGLVWARLGLAYPASAFEEAWRDILFNQFHDILPGSGVPATRTYADGLYQKAMAATGQAETQALRLLAAQIDTAGAGPAALAQVPPLRIVNSIGAGVGYGSADGGLSQADQTAGQGPWPFVLFNPTAIDRNEVVLVVVWEANLPEIAALKTRSFGVRGPDGKLRPAQMADSGNFWRHERVTLAFPAAVPGLGYARYTIEEMKFAEPPTSDVRQLGKKHHCGYAIWERSPEGLENESLRVEIDPVSGGIRKLLEKKSGLELIAPAQPAPALEYLVERTHGMSSWQVQHSGSPVEYPKVRALRRSIEGPYKAAIEVELRIHESDFTLTYELRAGDPKLYVHITGNWFQRGDAETGVPALNFALPLAVTGARARYEIPFGAIDRDLNHGEEAPALQWAQVTGKIRGRKAGCLLLNDCKHGHSLDGNTLRLTLIRGSYEPDLLPEIGRHEIHLALRPFAGELALAEAIREGQVFNHPVRVVSTDVHKGTLPEIGQFIRVAPAPVVLNAIKKAEDDAALILRLFNPTNRKVTAQIKSIGRLLAPWAKVEEVDLLERPVAKSSCRASGRLISVAVPARGIVSLRAEINNARNNSERVKKSPGEGAGPATTLKNMGKL
ncbi:MAG: glycoside hydrolase family 38 C-terminal domain-containing protein [Kiritimatiellia bacterium]|jgi:alpha-mannosidase